MACAAQDNILMHYNTAVWGDAGRPVGLNGAGSIFTFGFINASCIFSQY